MTSFNENDVNRASDGKFAAKTTGETDPSTLGSTGNVTVASTSYDGTPMYREDFEDGTYRHFVVDDFDPDKQFSTYYDADGKIHRDGGPAQIDKNDISWYQHGVVTRDPHEGPAWIGNDGSCGYMVDGKTVADPGSAAMREQGVEKYRQYGKDSYAIADSSASFMASNGELHSSEPQPDELDEVETLSDYFYDGRGV